VTAVAPTLQAFFTQYLIGQRQASPHTVSAYRDAFRLLLTYIADRTGKSPARLDFDDLDATTISAFLTHLERDRGVSAASARRPATPGWPRCGRCSSSPPTATRSTPR